MAGLGYETESSGGAQPVNGLLALPDCVLITIITFATGRWESLWEGRVGDGLSRRAEGVPSAWITGKAHVLAYVNIPQASRVLWKRHGRAFKDYQWSNVFKYRSQEFYTWVCVELCEYVQMQQRLHCMIEAAHSAGEVWRGRFPDTTLKKEEDFWEVEFVYVIETPSGPSLPVGEHKILVPRVYY